MAAKWTGCVWTMLALACLTGCGSDQDSDYGGDYSGLDYACRYETKSDNYCSSGSHRGDWGWECFEVGSAQDCYEDTQDYTINSGSCTTSYSYRNVTATIGSCEDAQDPAKKTYGEFCDESSECESDLCMIAKDSGRGYCSKTCSSNAGCDLGSDQGSGYCLDFQDGKAKKCVILCNDGQCPAGMWCKQGSSAGLCIP